MSNPTYANIIKQRLLAQGNITRRTASTAAMLIEQLSLQVERYQTALIEITMLSTEDFSSSGEALKVAQDEAKKALFELQEQKEAK